MPETRRVLFREAFPETDPSPTAELEAVERGFSPGGVPLYNLDWCHPLSPFEWRPEWQAVLDELRSMKGAAQNAGMASICEMAWQLCRKARPSSTANVCAQAVDRMEAALPGQDHLHAWVCTAIREAMHRVVRREKLWQDPDYAVPKDERRDAFMKHHTSTKG